MKTFVPILQFVLISFLVGYISMLLQREAMMEWYPTLEKSSLTENSADCLLINFHTVGVIEH